MSLRPSPEQRRPWPGCGRHTPGVSSKSMRGLCGLDRWRRFAAVAIALYAVILVAAPFEHHDLACHLKTPQHCSSCNASPLSSTPNTSVALQTYVLDDAGRLLVGDSHVYCAAPLVSRFGRSPPASL
jgi:hypothetical protein